MDLVATETLPCSRSIAHAELETLDGYPAWLGIVSRVVVADPEPGDEGPAWWVDLGAGVGPFRLKKRVRMVRGDDTPGRVCFERCENDGADHHRWALEVLLTPAADATAVEVRLHYGGSLPPLVDRFLALEVGRAGPRLIRRITAVG